MRATGDEAAFREAWRTIVNPASGETVTFLETAEESGGARVVLHIEIAPGGGAAPHAHRYETEAFEVLAGTVDLQVGTQRIALAVGETATVSPGTLHGFRNSTAVPATLRVALSR